MRRLALSAATLALLAGSVAVAQTPAPAPAPAAGGKTMPAAAAAMAAQAAPKPEAKADLKADLKSGAGAVVGDMALTAAPTGVLLRVQAKGLTPGWHGLHFHEKADCSKADFTSAGGHTHGAGDRVHGLLNPAGNETGDLPNIWADAQGVANAEVFSTRLKLSDLRDADGSALVIHAAADDHMAQPIGGAGARVACGEIR